MRSFVTCRCARSWWTCLAQVHTMQWYSGSDAMRSKWPYLYVGVVCIWRTSGGHGLCMCENHTFIHSYKYIHLYTFIHTYMYIYIHIYNHCAIHKSFRPETMSRSKYLWGLNHSRCKGLLPSWPSSFCTTSFVCKFHMYIQLSSAPDTIHWSRIVPITTFMCISNIPTNVIYSVTWPLKGLFIFFPNLSTSHTEGGVDAENVVLMACICLEALWWWWCRPGVSNECWNKRQNVLH